MKQNLVNEVRAEGYLYEHKLEKKVSKANVEYIGGTISLATDEECTNIVMFHFVYVTPTYSKSGATNPNYKILENIIASGTTQTVMGAGKEKALKIRLNSTIGLNEFYDRNDAFVSVKRNEGGFVHVAPSIADDEKVRNTFECDIIINNVIHVEGDEEKGTTDKATVKGVIFNFRKDLMPVEFSVTNPKAMAYFEDLGASNSNPIFTKIKGRQISESIVRRVEEESAFGEPSVKEVRNTRRDFVITGAAANTYDWDDESTMTTAELAKAVSEREVYLAGLKQRQEEYKASKGAAPAIAANPATAGFNF